jgi:hypothetical protein
MELQARSKRELQKNFDQFLPSGDDAPPEAPSEQTTQPVVGETTSEPAQKKAKPAKKDPAPESEQDPEIDSFKLGPRASAEQHDQFRNLKAIAKAGKSEAKALRNGLAPVLREFNIEMNGHDIGSTMQEFADKVRALKTTGIPQETQEELQNLRILARGVGLLQSEEFTRDFAAPVNAAYVDVIREMSQYFDADPQQVKADFTDPLLESGQFNPGNIPASWWDEQSALMHKAPPAIKEKIRQKVANVLLLQERHDEAAKTLSTDSNSYAKWQREQQQKQLQEGQRVWQEATRDESEKALAEEAFRDLAEARTRLLAGNDSDKKAFEGAVNDVNKFISDVLSGPRTAIRRGMEFLQLRIRVEKLAGLEEDLAAANKEIVRLKGRVVQSRKTVDAPFSGGHASGASKPAAPGLPKDGLKSLDAAFKNHNWDVR